MTDLLVLLYWCAVAALMGGVVALVVPLRRMWLIVPVAALALVFVLTMIPSDHETAASVTRAAFLLALYVLGWTGGVFAGTALRSRMWRRLRRYRARAAGPPLS